MHIVGIALDQKGKRYYITKNSWGSNAGIDGFMKEHCDGMPVPVKIQAEYETIEDSIEKLERACMGKNYVMKIIVKFLKI